MNDAEFLDQFSQAIGRRAEFWRTNSDDPHGIGTAVYVALVEVQQALANARAQKILEGKEENRERVYNPLPK